jgi:hypothetical protein
VPVLNEFIKRLHQLRQEMPSKKKYLFLAISFKGGPSILPPDMRITGGYTPSKTGYAAYKYMWPYSGAGSIDGGNGYFIKAWDPVVLNRFSLFCEKLANYVVPGTDGEGLDAGDYLYMMSSLESVVQDLADPAFPGWSLTTYQDSILEMVKRMRNNLPNTMTSICLNYTRPFVTRTMPKLAALKIGINTPNSNFADGLVLGGANPGILNYFQNPAYIDNIVLNPEIQGDDYFSTYGADARIRARNYAKQATPNWAAVDAEYDFPSYSTLHNRCRNDLHANIIVAQRTFPFWLGGTYSEKFTLSNGSTVTHTFPGTRPSFLNFLKTDPDVLAWLGESNPPPTNWILTKEAAKRCWSTAWPL